MSKLNLVGLLAACILSCAFQAKAREGSDMNTLLTHTHTPTHILGLKPIPNSYQLAKATFLPDAGESNFGNRDSLDKDYNTADCKNKSSLYTTRNCTYPRAVSVSSKCPFAPGYYKECVCLPQFKISSCTSPKILSSPTCNGKAASCVCPSSVSLVYSNDRCTQYCDGNCIAKSCTPTASETGCQYGTTSVTNGCGGTRTVCKACSPLSDQTGCQYGTYSCSNGCGGTRKCCSSCSPYSNETGCQYGTESCSNGCGGTRTCCKAKPACTPYASQSGCSYGTVSCSDGCGGTRTCCASKPSVCYGSCTNDSAKINTFCNNGKNIKDVVTMDSIGCAYCVTCK